MGNKKGYVPSEEAKRKTSESLKKAYADGRRQVSEAQKQAVSDASKQAWADGRHSRVVSEEQKRKTSETLKRGYAEGRIQLVGSALANSQSPFVARTDEERKARKLETQRVWRENNPEINAEYHRKYHPLDYGWTAEQYDAEVAKRNGLCDICGRPQQNGIRLAIDHDHECCADRSACEKCRRGLLCTNCNTLLGSAHDSVEILQQAILYLNSFKKEKGQDNVERIHNSQTD